MNVSGGAVTAIFISGLDSDATYSIEVAAVNSAGTGVYSAPLSVSTLGKIISITGYIAVHVWCSAYAF